MAVRKERVIVELEDLFTSRAARMAAASGALGKSFDRADRSVVAFDKTVRTSGSSIDQLSGRLSVLARAATALGPGFVPITAMAVPAIAGLTTQLGFAAAGAGTAMLAFNGVGDALEAFREYQAEPTAENLEKLNDKFKGLGPAAQEFVSYLDEIIPQLQTVREAAQDMLPGIQEGLDALIDRRLPQVRDIVSEIATTTGDLFAAAGAELASGEWDAFFNFVQSEAKPALETLGQTVGNVAKGIAELWMAMDPFSDDFTAGLLEASEAFERWAEGLAQTQGFRDFLAYVRETGPQVLETVGSIANALLQVVEAAAPLGGPVLNAIEAVADAVALIADSPIGPTLMAAATAMSALSLASKGFATVVGSGAATNVRGLTSDLKTMGATGVVAWGRTTDETLRYNEAAGRVKSTLAGLGTGAAAIGGLALASSDLGDSLGLTNTGLGAMYGAIAGPWGSAVGSGIGLAVDFGSAVFGMGEAIKAANEAAASGNIAEMEAQLARLRFQGEKANRWLTTLAATLPAVGGPVEWFTDKTDEASKAEKRLARELRNARAAAVVMGRATTDSAAATRDAAEAIDFETRSLAANIDAMRDKRMETLRAEDAEINYEAAIDDARRSLKENGRTLDITTEKGRANRRALLDMASAWNDQSDAVKNSKGAHRDAIGTFVRVATQMGMNERKARRYARELFEIPANRTTKIHAEAGQAFRTINGVKVALRNLDGTVSTTYIRTVRSEHMANRLERGRADGGIDFYAAGGVRETAAHRLCPWLAGPLSAAEFYANGGLRSLPSIGSQMPQIQPNHGPRGIMWAETGAGPWEAFVSGHPAKKERSRAITEEVADRLGGDVQWKAADGLVLERRRAEMVATRSGSSETRVVAQLDYDRLADAVASRMDRIGADVQRGAAAGSAEGIGRLAAAAAPSMEKIERAISDLPRRSRDLTRGGRGRD